MKTCRHFPETSLCWWCDLEAEELEKHRRQVLIRRTRRVVTVVVAAIVGAVLGMVLR